MHTAVGMKFLQDWTWQAKGLFPCCLARMNITYNVNEVLWHDPAQRHGAE